MKHAKQFALAILLSLLSLPAYATYAQVKTNHYPAAFCHIQYREVTNSGLIQWSTIRSTRAPKRAVDFISPKDGKTYRLRVFTHTDTTGIFFKANQLVVDAIIQDLSVKEFSPATPQQELTTANGYIAHTVVSVAADSGPIPSLVIASEANGLVVECRNVK